MASMSLTVWLFVLGIKILKSLKRTDNQIFRGFELFYGHYYGVTEGGLGLSVLRTFRLLRIIKLVRLEIIYQTNINQNWQIQISSQPPEVTDSDAEDHG